MDLEARVAELERQLELLAEQPGQWEIPVRVVDPRGKALVAIDDADGTLRMTLFDYNGEPSMVLAVPEDGIPVVRMGNHTYLRGDGSACLSSGEGPALHLAAQGSEASIRLEAGEGRRSPFEIRVGGEWSRIRLQSSDGETPGIELRVRSDGHECFLTLGGTEEQPAIELYCCREHGPSLVLRDPEGNPFFQICSP